jgi:esterase/lipase
MSKASNPTKSGKAMELLLAAESELFIKEYEENYSEGESKPPNIGMPFFLHSPGSDTGVLLIHGLMAAPEEVKEWAIFLHEKGLTVYAPRLSGHGTSSKDLSVRNYNDWLHSVDRGHAILKTCCKKILVAGFSTGAGLALQSVILKPHDFQAVIAVSVPLKFKSFSSRFAETLNGFNLVCNYWGMGKLAREFLKNEADNPHINYLRCPVSSFVQVKRLMKKVRKSLPDIFIPSLVIQAKDDPKVAPESGPAIFKLLGTDKKHFSWIDYNMHGIVRGEIALEVFKEVESFLTAYSLISPSKDFTCNISCRHS